MAADTQWAGALAGRVLTDEMPAQGLQIFRALPQWLDPQRELAEPVEQVAAEPALFDAVTQWLMGGRDQSKIRVLFLLSSKWAEASAFQHPQQFGLQSHGHVADLIQEQGAAIRLRQQTFLGSVGTGKRTLGMAKKFTFQQRVRDGGAIDHH